MAVSQLQSLGTSWQDSVTPVVTFLYIFVCCVYSIYPFLYHSTVLYISLLKMPAMKGIVFSHIEYVWYILYSINCTSKLLQ